MRALFKFEDWFFTTRLFANVDIFELLCFSFTLDSQLSFLLYRIKDKPQARFENMFMSNFLTWWGDYNLVNSSSRSHCIQRCKNATRRIHLYAKQKSINIIVQLSSLTWALLQLLNELCQQHNVFMDVSFMITFRKRGLFLDWPLFSCLNPFQTFHNIYCSKSAYMLHWRQLKGNILI